MKNPYEGKDRRGIMVQIGDMVAFHTGVGGNLAYGMVKNIKVKKQKHYQSQQSFDAPLYEVECLDKVDKGHVFKIADAKRLLVINGAF